MQFEASKYFIGLMDFFTILLPGTILVYRYQPWLSDWSGIEPLPGEAGVALFLIASWILGHFIFAISSKVLDDWFYDPIRGIRAEPLPVEAANSNTTNPTDANQPSTPHSLCIQLSKLWSWLILKLNCAFFGENQNVLAELVRRLRDLYVAKQSNGKQQVDPINAFEWSKFRLASIAPAARAEVERLEADSKFFRSLTLLVAFDAIVQALSASATRAVASAVLAGLATWRFTGRRFKATQTAYQALIAHETGPQGSVDMAGGKFTRRPLPASKPEA